MTDPARPEPVRPDPARIESVRIEPGGYLVIDTSAWIGARTGGRLPDLTADLHEWAQAAVCPGPEPEVDGRNGPRAWQATVRAWCEARGYRPAGVGVIEHAESRLDAAVWVLPAVTAGGQRIVVVGINHDPPSVHTDTSPDTWAWCDPDSVVIACPGGHAWTWRAGRELITAAGRPTTLTVVFGPGLDAPFSLCPQCAAHQLGHSRAPCGCDRTPWIVCPVCGQRCHLTLPRP
jgi:hypothetical protein